MRRCLLAIVLFATTAVAQDIRILIDISGSMAENDPQNLRRPALELLIESIPTGAKAGVWTFGQYVNMLVKHETVDRAWRRQARAELDEIVSIAQRTNIGGALETSAYDLNPVAPSEPVTYLLLTDGFVDVSPAQARNFAERNRILQNLLPNFRDANATIHTIALSESADTQLLDFLAYRTDGVSTIVTSADDLPRIFADLLGVAVASEQIPLTDEQGFVVDDSVSEVTALMFVEPGGDLMLQSPAGEIIDQATNRTDVRWYRDQRYALVTIVEPVAGEWSVVGALAPGSRVNVVANLSLDVEQPITNLVIGESIDLAASMVAQDVIPEQILAQTSVVAQLSEPGQMPVKTQTLSRSGNQFTGVLDNLPGGSWRLDITAESGTFSRRRSFLVTVRQPFSAEVTNATGNYQAVLRSHSERNQVTQVLAEFDDGSVVALRPIDDYWQADLPAANSVQMVVTYESEAGLKQWRSGVFPMTSADAFVQPIMATATPMPATPTPQATPMATPEPTPEPTVEPTPEPTREMTPPVSPTLEVDMWAQAEEQQGINWIAFAIAGGIGVAVLGAAFYLFKRYESRMREEESIELADEDAEAPSTSASIDVTLDDIDLDESMIDDSSESSVPTPEPDQAPAPESEPDDDDFSDLGQPEEDLPDDLDSLQSELDKLSGEIGDPNMDIDDTNFDLDDEDLDVGEDAAPGDDLDSGLDDDDLYKPDDEDK
ncbi:VWA domain-containing protein [Salinibius halmophilus]|uniref:VWA domain-containing protein n=1 Tax=Salinibius halmophilus TaxID=1853216 RepID=UPI000E66155F|nr:VWA domain-containing protein [Salinibius halmophilus]